MTLDDYRQFYADEVRIAAGPGELAAAFARVPRERFMGAPPWKVASVVAIYSCTSVRDPEMSAALAKALASKALFKFRSVRTHPHEQQETCLAHGADICLSTADLQPLDQASGSR